MQVRYNGETEGDCNSLEVTSSFTAGQVQNDRSAVQGAWLRGEAKVVCATIAYGMVCDASLELYGALLGLRMQFCL